MKWWQRLTGKTEDTAELPKMVELVNVRATALDPTKKYVFIFDKEAVSAEQATMLFSEMRKDGIPHAVGMMVDGDPNTCVLIVEQP